MSNIEAYKTDALKDIEDSEGFVLITVNKEGLCSSLVAGISIADMLDFAEYLITKACELKTMDITVESTSTLQ